VNASAGGDRKSCAATVSKEKKTATEGKANHVRCRPPCGQRANCRGDGGHAANGRAELLPAAPSPGK